MRNEVLHINETVHGRKEFPHEYISTRVGYLRQPVTGIEKLHL